MSFFVDLRLLEKVDTDKHEGTTVYQLPMMRFPFVSKTKSKTSHKKTPNQTNKPSNHQTNKPSIPQTNKPSQSIKPSKSVDHVSV